jgi:pimeloyl-ACP methyl ester carboxylesterase
MRWIDVARRAVVASLAISLGWTASAQNNAPAGTEPPPAAEEEGGSNVQIRSIRVVPPPAPSLEPRIAFLDEAFPFDAAQPAAGHWMGNVLTPIGVPAGSLLIEKDSSGAWRVVASLPPLNVPHRTCTDVVIEGRLVRFTFPVYPKTSGVLTFEGEVSEDGQRLAGRVSVPEPLINDHVRMENLRREYDNKPVMSAEEVDALRRQVAAESRFEFGRAPTPMSLPEPLAFGGKVQLFEDFAFDITVVAAQTPGGNWVAHIDIPDQMIAAWAIDRVERDGERLTLIMGGAIESKFEGVVAPDNSTYKGTFHQAEEAIPFEFKRLPDYTVPAYVMPDLEEPGEEVPASPVANRPQYPGDPLPYLSIDTTIRTEDGELLAGTLSVPNGEGPFPTAVLLSGTGPHDRDYLAYGHKVNLVLADRLTRAGFAVLRYDERGTGKSSGRFQGVTTIDFARDAASVAKHARALDKVNPEKVGFIGHGEGAIAAILAAKMIDDPAFVVLLGAPGLDGAAHEVGRTESTIASLEADAALKQAVVDAERALIEAFVAGEPEERTHELALAFADAQRALAEASGARTTSRESTARMRVARLRSPWMSALLAIDPAAELAALDCPVLACWGDLDRECPPASHRAPLEDAAKAAGVAFTAKVYPSRNHLFQPAETGETREYSKSTITFDEQAMKDIAAWIAEWTK